MKPLLIATAALALFTHAASAQTLILRASDQFADYLAGRTYEANVLPPANTGAPFIRRASGTIASESVANGALTFRTDNTGGNTLSWQVGAISPSGPVSPTWWTNNADPTKGFTVEFRLKALSSQVISDVTVDYRFNFIASYNTATSDSQVLAITESSILWGSTVLSTLDNDDDFHIFRLVRLPNANVYQLWRDNVLIKDDLAGSISAQNRFWFGDWGGQPGGGVLDYLRWDTSGAYAPVPEPGTVALLVVGSAGFVFLARRRRNG